MEGQREGFRQNLVELVGWRDSVLRVVYMLPSILSSYLCLDVLRLGMVRVAKEKPLFLLINESDQFPGHRLPIFYIEIVGSWLRAVREGMHSLSLSRRPSKADLPSSGTQPLPSYALFI